MASFAQIVDNIVVGVLKVDNADCDNLDFPESETVGQAFLASIGVEGDFLQTSFSRQFRGNFAGVGDVYNEDLDVFHKPQIYPSWELDETYTWKAPVEMPLTTVEGGMWDWNEDELEWEQITSA
jgi:hypothetical protein